MGGHGRISSANPPATAVGKARRAEVSKGANPIETSQAIKPGVVRVLCVDDHTVLVDGLKARFGIEDGIDVVGHLSTAERLVEETIQLRPNVVLLDIEMPGPDAFEMADRMHRKCPDVSVIVLSAHIRDAFISASFRAGICGYFAKGDELSDIVSGVRDAAKGHKGQFCWGPRFASDAGQCSKSSRPVVAPAVRRQRWGRSRLELCWNH